MAVLTCGTISVSVGFNTNTDLVKPNVYDDDACMTNACYARRVGLNFPLCQEN